MDEVSVSLGMPNKVLFQSRQTFILQKKHTSGPINVLPKFQNPVFQIIIC